MQFDGLFLWTDNASAPPAPTSSPDDRRRRYVGGVRHAVLFFLTVLGARL